MVDPETVLLKCPDCRGTGRGEVWTASGYRHEGRTCDRCRGSGKYEKLTDAALDALGRPDGESFRCPVCATAVVMVKDWPNGGRTITTACSERWKWRPGDASLTVDNPEGTGHKCRSIASTHRALGFSNGQ